MAERQRSSSCSTNRRSLNLSDVAGDIAVITSVDKMHSPLVVADPQPNQAAAESKEKKLLTWEAWVRTPWTEDWIGIALAMVLFCITTALACNKQKLENYWAYTQWPLGAIASGYFVVIFGHHYMNKKQCVESYGLVLLVAVAAKAIGGYEVFAKNGLTSSFWGIILGMALNAGGVRSPKEVVSGEFFIKIGVTLMAMDISRIVSVGAPGLVVAWLDTLIVFYVGYNIACKWNGIPQKDAIIVAGATTICGSSAATAIAACLEEKEPIAPDTVSSPLLGDEEGVKPSPPAAAPGKKENTVDTIVALMGLFNTPLMPVLPLLNILGGMSPIVIGSWIGGCVDSTGQVIASASLGSQDMLITATVIKIAQNLLIGPICLVLTVVFQKTYSLSILADKFPIFVIGFFITSIVVTALAVHPDVPSNIADLVQSNTWCMGEWMNLIGFARIGLKIDVMSFFAKEQSDIQQKILYAYFIIQGIDICTTLAWSYLIFKDNSYDDDDNQEPY